jgi:hypothetical protein
MKHADRFHVLDLQSVSLRHLLLRMRFKGVHGAWGKCRASQAEEKQGLTETLAPAKTNPLHARLPKHTIQVFSAILAKPLVIFPIGLAQAG